MVKDVIGLVAFASLNQPVPYTTYAVFGVGPVVASDALNVTAYGFAVHLAKNVLSPNSDVAMVVSLRRKLSAGT